VSRFRIQYANEADASRRAMAPAFRTAFEQAMAKTLGSDPYGHGSKPIKGEADYREATIGGAFVVYYISSEVLVVTAVRIVF
jgi:mRNA-degrading endonuclease RelE of RelBE toxin-antitoxin system